jgi:hypothetical protein
MGDYMTPQIAVLLIVGAVIAALGGPTTSVEEIMGGAAGGLILVSVFVFGLKALYRYFTSENSRRRWLTWGPATVGVFFMIGGFLQNPYSSVGVGSGLFMTAVIAFPARWLWLHASNTEDTE